MDITLLATDQQRSIMQAVDRRSPSSIAYTPYGYRRKESGLASLLGFNGELLEAGTRHYLLGNGYRAFNPILLRFNSPDSLSPFREGGINAYCYCSGDPVNRNDPEGRMWKWVIKASHPQTTKNAASKIQNSRAFWAEAEPSEQMYRDSVKAVIKRKSSEKIHLDKKYEESLDMDVDIHRLKYRWVMEDIKKLPATKITPNSPNSPNSLPAVVPSEAKKASALFKAKTNIKKLASERRRVGRELVEVRQHLVRLHAERLQLEVESIRLTHN